MSELLDDVRVMSKRRGCSFVVLLLLSSRIEHDSLRGDLVDGLTMVVRVSVMMMLRLLCRFLRCELLDDSFFCSVLHHRSDVDNCEHEPFFIPIQSRLVTVTLHSLP